MNANWLVGSKRLLERIVALLLIAIVYSASSALVMDRFMRENGSINQPHGGFDRYIQHQVLKPFAYRVLVPALLDSAAPIIIRHASDSLKNKLTKETPLRDYMKLGDSQEIDLSMSARYHLAYFLCFASLVGLQFVLKGIADTVAPDRSSFASFAPVLFVVLLPLTFLHGGFLYDFPELFFLSAALLLMLREQFWALCALIPLAVLNKESNVVLPLVYAVYVYGDSFSPKRKEKALLLFVIAAGAYSAGHLIASDVGGVVVMHHLGGNLSFMIDYHSYFLWERLYGGLLAFPRGYNLLVLAALSVMIAGVWSDVPSPMKRVFAALLPVNLVLVLAFGNRDEIRNWSLMFPTLYFFAISFFVRLERSECGDVPMKPAG